MAPLVFGVRPHKTPAQRSNMKLQLTQAVPGSRTSLYFDGWDTSKANYQFKCPTCGTRLEIDFSTVHAGAWRWKESFSPDEVEELTKTFGLPQERAPQPWPSLSRIACRSCKTNFVFHAGVDEYRNSAFRLTALGLARCEV